ncbi:methyltransferase [Glaciibacter psychrotolerans]|uniref:Putative O-methyltransferase YrrM n=1 Tax=Glaciibacter psychrotolerans TaxID=670054 RepID=A0A7Z0J7F3_9MICO|nr:class I SAM-dependent methyltransferase [Leifsonia psychrotolerans]NYJ21216.1 putative O-methyltransferase YrrM [Leifsonia psychrotolerans]
MPRTSPPAARVSWVENGEAQSALWRSDGGWPAPTRIVIADDTTTADAAYRHAASGTALLWRGDFNNARQLLSALGARIDKRQKPRHTDLTQAFRTHRTDAATRARLLGLLLVPLDADFAVPLRRAPDVRTACVEAFGAVRGAAAAESAVDTVDSRDTVDSLISLRELVGVIGAHEWREQGVPVPALGARIHPHYGVFSPIRGEYLDLVAQAPLPGAATDAGGIAFDIGVGTGVLSAILATRGVTRVQGTDLDDRALACATDNITRLGLSDRVDIVRADLFAEGTADLIVCNPPWIPAEATTSTDHAVYDPDSRMLRGFLTGLAAHLNPGGEGWLIISDIAERLGLRSRGELLDLIDAAGLIVVARLDTRPTHPRATDRSDPLYAARAAEVTSLWRLATA